ncbi:hypothetical protein ACS0TY_026369 [Phlomoides rotata]
MIPSFAPLSFICLQSNETLQIISYGVVNFFSFSPEKASSTLLIVLHQRRLLKSRVKTGNQGVTQRTLNGTRMIRGS